MCELCAVSDGIDRLELLMPLLTSGNGPYLVKEASWVVSGEAGWLCRAAGISGIEPSHGERASGLIGFVH